MDFVRTPDENFNNLPDYPFTPNYIDVDDGALGTLRMHYLDEGGADGEIILCLHGQPSWSYLYRKMIPLLTAAGYRVIAPDLIGFGKSDKPTKRSDYTYAAHVTWLKSFVEKLDLRNVTMVCQDWGSLIGLRVVPESASRFSRIVLANGGLPDAREIPAEMAPQLHALLADTPALPIEEMFARLSGAAGEQDRPPFMYWVRYCDEHADFHPAHVMKASLQHCSDEEYRAWAAPFPAEEYMQGARQFPSLVPIIPDNPAISANRMAWEFYAQFNKPFLTAFSDSDPVTSGGEKRWIESVPGAKGQKHTIIKGGGHFLQDDVGAELAAVVIAFIQDNPG